MIDASGCQVLDDLPPDRVERACAFLRELIFVGGECVIRRDDPDREAKYAVADDCWNCGLVYFAGSNEFYLRVRHRRIGEVA